VEDERKGEDPGDRPIDREEVKKAMPDDDLKKFREAERRQLEQEERDQKPDE
jgi:hypothetical protein